MTGEGDDAERTPHGVEGSIIKRLLRSPSNAASSGTLYHVVNKDIPEIRVNHEDILETADGMVDVGILEIVGEKGYDRRYRLAFDPEAGGDRVGDDE